MRRKIINKIISLLCVLAMVVSIMPTSVHAVESDNHELAYRIVHLDCGRKYFSPDNIKKVIDNASDAGFNYVELALGNDGLRFLLDDMSLTANGQEYVSDSVKAGIQKGNQQYSNFTTNELTETQMDDIISYAAEKNVSIIPLINTPGHMDAILTCMSDLGVQNAAYGGSARTIDVTNTEAVAFTQALLQKYIDYFAKKGCTVFNMGADEYANDVYTSGGMGFGQLQAQGQYGSFVQYVNAVSQQIKQAGMTPMAFNDGIYYAQDTSSGTFDKDIVIDYWSNGWNGYSVASASFLADQGFQMVNTHGDYYWVLGKSDWQCTKDKASGFETSAFQGGTVSNPAGAMFCIWSDVPTADTDTNVVAQTAEVIQAFGKAIMPPSEPTDKPSDNNDNTDDDNTNEAVTTKTITLSVGGTETVTVDGDYSDQTAWDKSGLNTSIAAVSAEHEIIPGETTANKVTTIESGKEYLISDGKGNYLTLNGSSIENTTDANAAVKWTITASGDGYTIQNGNDYLSYSWSNGLTVGTTSYTWNYNSSRGFYTTSSSQNYYLRYNDSWGASRFTSTYGAPYETMTTEPQDQTTITFTGVAAGTTSVTIGGTVYTIQVEERAPSGSLTSDTLTIEYWITNSAVHERASDSSASQTSVNKEAAMSDEGVAVTALVPETGYSNYDGWQELHFWQAMREDSNHKQTGDSSVDQTTAGITFTHVRYRAGAWQYKTTDGTWHYFQSGDQAVAYYMKHTEITKEITTTMKDWGYVAEAGGSTPDTSSNKGQVALTVAVVYPDGTVSPAEGDMYHNSTTIFNYWSGRDIGIIAPLNNGDYDISKITVTDGARTSNTSSNTWSYSDTITWNKTTNAAGTQWYDETSVWDDSMNTAPMVSGKASDITWSAKNTAKLVLIYLKPVHHDTNLTVNWVDDSDSSALISTQEVVVSSTTETITFLNGLKQQSDVQAGEFTLDDNAYIVNSSGVNQTFNKDITTIPGVAGKYTSGMYKYYKADISEDGMTLTLHYQLDGTKVAHQYVVDFGLPMEVPLNELVEKTNNIASVVTSDNVRYDETKQAIVYTPKSILKDTEPATVRIKYTDQTTTSSSIGFVPATSVYYEDSFIQFSNGWTAVGENNADSTQQLNTTPYGTDTAYNANTTYSNGSAQYVDIAQGGNQETANFSFKGTGFDLYSKTGKNNGLMKVQVKKDGQVVKTVSVQNTGINDLYQIPVVSIEGLKNDNYDVTVTAYGAYTNEKYTALSRGGEHIIDAVTIYDTMDTSNTEVQKQYVTDNEAFVQRLEVRNAIISAQQYHDNTEGNGVLHIEADGATGTVEDYTSVGPNNEVYFDSNSTHIAFILETSQPAKTIQIGAKSVDGKPVTLRANGQDFAINTNTAQNYVLTLPKATTEDNKYQYAIDLSRSGGEGILSVTDVKATFGEEATAQFKYNDTLVDFEKATEGNGNTIESVEITTSRVRYNRTMAMKVTTAQALGETDHFTVTVGNKTYDTKHGLTVLDGVNNDGQYVYTLTLKPTSYQLFGESTFTVHLLNAENKEITSGSASTRVNLF